MNTTAQLQKIFDYKSVTFSEAAPGYPMVSVSNASAKATIAFHGAHLTAFQPKGEKPVIWTSASAIYKEGKAIRGGVPICWPWFGDAAGDNLPAHGFARNRFWDLQSVEEQGEDATILTFTLVDDEATRKLWPHAFLLTMKVTIAGCLTLRLKSCNTGTQTFSLTNALHSYLSIHDIKTTSLSGLDAIKFKDKLTSDKVFVQAGHINIDAEVDRVYKNTTAPVLVNDPGNRRKIKVEKSGSRSTVIWNPWIEKSSAMADFELGGFRHMVCVEAANVDDAAIELAPGETQVLETCISVEAE